MLNKTIDRKNLRNQIQWFLKNKDEINECIENCFSDLIESEKEVSVEEIKKLSEDIELLVQFQDTYDYLKTFLFKHIKDIHYTNEDNKEFKELYDIAYCWLSSTEICEMDW